MRKCQATRLLMFLIIVFGTLCERDRASRKHPR